MYQLYQANRIVKFIGIGLTLMGIFYIFGVIRLTDWQITCYSLSAFMFVISDYIEFTAEKYENSIVKSQFKDKIKVLGDFRDIFQILAIFFITWIPFVHLDLSKEFLAKLGNTILLIGLGGTIFLIGKRMDKKVTDTITKISQKEQWDAQERQRKLELEQIKNDKDVQM